MQRVGEMNSWSGSKDRARKETNTWTQKSHRGSETERGETEETRERIGEGSTGRHGVRTTNTQDGMGMFFLEVRLCGSERTTIQAVWVRER